MSVVDCIIGC